jgi:hypothetical protein
MSALVAPILLACSGTQLALLEGPVAFTVEVGEEAVNGEGGPFLWVTNKLRRSDKSLIQKSNNQIFSGNEGRNTLEMEFSPDHSSVNWVVLEPTRKKDRFRIGISGTATCQALSKETAKP